jgi:6-phosphogluconate dehydrogenase
MADIFDEWNRGALESFLIEITAKILRVDDPETGKPLVDLVLDQAGQKGTGRWTSQVALELGIVIPTINASIDSRTMSSRKAERVEASKQLSGPKTSAYTGDKRALIRAVHDALYASKICSYAQGMNLIRAGSENWKWDINLGEVSRSGRAAASSARNSSTRSSRPTSAAPICRTCCSIRISARG